MRAVSLRVAGTVLLIVVILGLGWAGLRYWRPLRVAGGSMRPALFPGDLVIVDIGSRAGRDQIALLRSPRHGLVLHRVLSSDSRGTVTTRGDANPIADFDSLPASAVVGPVVLVVPVGGLLERWRGSGSCATITAQ